CRCSASGGSSISLTCSSSPRAPACARGGRSEKLGLELVDFRHDETLRPASEPDGDLLARAQLADPEPAQRFHVHEDVRCLHSARNEAVAFRAVEPLHARRLESAERRNIELAWKRRCASLRIRLRRVAVVVINNTKSLQAFGALHRFANDACAFADTLIS